MNSSIIICILAILSITLAGCAQKALISQETSPNPSEKTFSATFYPVADATKAIVGDSAQVISLVPQGIEPHDYEPTPQDIIKLAQSDAFITIGAEFGHFEDELISSVGESVPIISSSKNIILLDAKEPHDHNDEENRAEKMEEHAEEHEEEVPHAEFGKDPHLWLSPTNMIQMSENIKTGLIAINPSAENIYSANAQKHIQELKKLDADFRIGLSDCKKDVVLVNHAAFAYLAHDYGFDQIAIGGLEPDAEPTPQQIVSLIEEAKEHGLKYVFYEELVDPKIANIIAREVGATTLELSPIEGTTNQEDTYISIMRRNLENLRLALECE